MPQLAVRRPLDEADLDDDFGAHPVRAQARQPGTARERRRRSLERVEPGAERDQLPGIEAGADATGEHEVLVLEVSDEQRAEPDAAPLRVGEAAHDELLRLF